MLKVENLCKRYETFQLKNVSFELPAGYIMGFIGINGAGKSTTIKSILNLVHPDSGSVTVLGKDMYRNEIELKQRIGFMLGPVDYYLRIRIARLAGVIGRFYSQWDERQFFGYLEKFGIDPHKRISELSTGMRVKLGIAIALSHGAKLIILDEPTSGLDPLARDELLELFQEIVADGERSILFSTHITSDLDKCADYIIFIRNGELVANDTKDDLIDQHAVVKGPLEALTPELEGRLEGFKRSKYGFSGLIRREKLQDSDAVQIEVPNLEDLMVYYNQEGAKS